MDATTSGFGCEAIDALPAQIALVDAHGRIVRTNRGWQDVATAGKLKPPAVSAPLDYLGECCAADARGCAEAGRIGRSVERVLRGEHAVAHEVYPCSFGGRLHWYQATIARYDGPEGPGALIMHVDVTELLRDPLTGVPNRTLYEAECAHVLGEASAAGALVGTILVDLDGFKRINDTFGHPAGDRLLVEVARRLREHVRKSDIVARIGGDEFAVVLSAVEGPDAAEAIAGRIVASIAEPFDLGREPVTLSASVGLALIATPGATADEMVERADRALYEAKNAGGNGFRRAA